MPAGTNAMYPNHAEHKWRGVELGEIIFFDKPAKKKKIKPQKTAASKTMKIQFTKFNNYFLQQRIKAWN